MFRHRRRFVTTKKNPKCHGKLFVLHIQNRERAEEEIFQALEKQMEKVNSQPPIPGGKEIRKCYIINYESSDLSQRVEECLKSQNIEVSYWEFAHSPLDGLKEADRVIFLRTNSIQEEEERRLKDWVAKEACICSECHLKLLLIDESKHVDGQRQHLRMWSFTEEYKKIDEGLLATSDPEEKLIKYCQEGPKNLLDQMMVRDPHIGLARALITNYFKIQLPNLRSEAEKDNFMPKFYLLCPFSGDCSVENLADSEKDYNRKGRTYSRTFTTAVRSKIISGKKVKFFMEYAPPTKVLFEMRESAFGGLLTEDDKKTEIRKFIYQIQALISESEDLRDFITVIPLVDGKETFRSEVEKIIEMDVKKWRADLETTEVTEMVSNMSPS